MYSVAFARGLAADRARKTGTVLLSVLAASLLLSQPAPAQSGPTGLEGQSIQITPEPNRLPQPAPAQGGLPAGLEGKSIQITPERRSRTDRAPAFLAALKAAISAGRA